MAGRKSYKQIIDDLETEIATETDSEKKKILELTLKDQKTIQKKREQIAKRIKTQSKKERAKETQKKILFGAFHFSWYRKNPSTQLDKKTAWGEFQKWLTKPSDRKAFDLEPLPKEQN